MVRLQLMTRRPGNIQNRKYSSSRQFGRPSLFHLPIKISLRFASTSLYRYRLGCQLPRSALSIYDRNSSELRSSARLKAVQSIRSELLKLDTGGPNGFRRILDSLELQTHRTWVSCFAQEVETLMRLLISDLLAHLYMLRLSSVGVIPCRYCPYQSSIFLRLCSSQILLACSWLFETLIDHFQFVMHFSSRSLVAIATLAALAAGNSNRPSRKNPCDLIAY